MRNIHIENNHAVYTFLSIAGIVIGFLVVENYLDEAMHPMFRDTGLLLMIMGGVGLSLTSSIKDDKLEITRYEYLGVSALVATLGLILTILPLLYYSMHSSGPIFTYTLAFITFVGYSLALGYSTKEFDLQKFLFAFIGGILILMGVMFMHRYRKYKMHNKRHAVLAQHVSVYNPGLVLFTVGWFLIAFSILSDYDE